MAGATDRMEWQRGPAKLRRVLVTPEGTSLNIALASAGARAGALALDIGIIIITLIVTLIALGLLTTLLPPGFDNSSFGEFMLVLLIIFVFLLRNAYFLYFELGERGATWGKRMVGIRVAARDGGRLTAEAVIARNIVRDIELFLPLMFIISGSVEGNMTAPTLLAGFGWVAIFLFFPLFNRDRLRCGDLIAGTWVVMAQRSKLGGLVAPSAAAKTTRSWAIYSFSEAELSVYGEYELQMLEQVLRGSNDAALETVCAAICGKIGWNPGTGDEREFLEAYYTQLRGRLENKLRFGKRRADKFSGEV